MREVRIRRTGLSATFTHWHTVHDAPVDGQIPIKPYGIGAPMEKVEGLSRNWVYAMMGEGQVQSGELIGRN